MVDHSLVVFGANAERRRYSMHETVRQFAQAQLRGSDQEADALERHARYYAQFVSHAAENRAGQTLPERLRSVQDDHDNLQRAAHSPPLKSRCCDDPATNSARGCGI